MGRTSRLRSRIAALQLPLWGKDHPKARAVRKLTYGTDVRYGTYASRVERGDAETAANTIICLICHATYLLDRQIRTLEKAFLKEGGLRERMTRARLRARDGNRPRERDA